MLVSFKLNASGWIPVDLQYKTKWN